MRKKSTTKNPPNIMTDNSIYANTENTKADSAMNHREIYGTKLYMFLKYVQATGLVKSCSNYFIQVMYKQNTIDDWNLLKI